MNAGHSAKQRKKVIGKAPTVPRVGFLLSVKSFSKSVVVNTAHTSQPKIT